MAGCCCQISSRGCIQREYASRDALLSLYPSKERATADSKLTIAKKQFSSAGLHPFIRPALELKKYSYLLGRHSMYARFAPDVLHVVSCTCDSVTGVLAP